MKKYFLIVGLILFGVAAILFFIDASPRMPLQVNYVSRTNQGYRFMLTPYVVTNSTDRDYGVHPHVQTLSNGVWIPPIPDPRTGTVFYLVPARNVQLFPSDFADHSQTTRVHLLYFLGPTPRQQRINAFLSQHGLPVIFYDREWKQFTSDPFVVPAP